MAIITVDATELCAAFAVCPAASPTLDPAVWRKFLRLLDEYSVAPDAMYLATCGSGFVPVFVTDGAPSVVTADACGGMLPCTQGEFEDVLIQVATHFDCEQFPPSVKFFGGYSGSPRCFRIDTPIVNLSGFVSPDDHLQSLSSKARSDIRRAMRATADVKVDLCTNPAEQKAGFQTAIRWTSQHWPGEAEYRYAVIQVLFAWACAENSRCRVLTAKRGDDLAAIGSYLIEGDDSEACGLFTMFASDRTNSVGVSFVQGMVADAIAAGVPRLDTAVVCSFTDVGESYSTYKRIGCNETGFICQYYVNPAVTEDFTAPAYIHDRWVL